MPKRGLRALPNRHFEFVHPSPRQNPCRSRDVCCAIVLAVKKPRVCCLPFIHHTSFHCSCACIGTIASNLASCRTRSVTWMHEPKPFFSCPTSLKTAPPSPPTPPNTECPPPPLCAGIPNGQGGVLVRDATCSCSIDLLFSGVCARGVQEGRAGGVGERILAQERGTGGGNRELIPPLYYIVLALHRFLTAGSSRSRAAVLEGGGGGQSTPPVRVKLFSRVSLVTHFCAWVGFDPTASAGTLLRASALRCLG